MRKRNIPKILYNFLEFLYYTKGFSVNTVKAQLTDLLIFFDFIKIYKEIAEDIEEFTVSILSTVTKNDINAFLVYLNFYRNNSARSRSRKITAIKNLYHWLEIIYVSRKIINPTIGIDKIKIKENNSKYLTLKQAEKLKNIFNKENNPDYERDNLILLLFLVTGMRYGELINIRLSDINFDNSINNRKSSIHITKSKDRRERMIPIEKTTEEKIKKYIKNKGITFSNMFLFTDSNYLLLSHTKLLKICKKAYKLIGIEEPGYTIHTLRHTAATILYTYTTRNIYTIKDFLGHTDVTSTQTYVHIEDKILKALPDLNPLSNYKLNENIKPRKKGKERRRYKVSAITYNTENIRNNKFELLDCQVDLILDALKLYIDIYRLFASKQNSEENRNEEFREALVRDTYNQILNQFGKSKKENPINE